MVAEGKQTVTALTRADSKGSVPAGVLSKQVDYSSHSSLVEALKGQEALIITMAVMAPRDQQSKLVEAAAEAGVSWILPNEWGSDTSHPTILQNPVNAGKTAMYSQIEKHGMNWIAFVNNQWWEWSLGGGYYGIDIPNRKVKFWDDGTATTVTTTWPRVGEGVAKLLALPISGSSPCLNDFKNQHAYVSSFYLSQREMLDAVQRETSTTDKDWEIAKEPVVAAYDQAREDFKNGNFRAAQTIIYAGNFIPNGGNDYIHTKETLNKLLSLPQEDLQEAAKRAVQYSKEHKPVY